MTRLRRGYGGQARHLRPALDALPTDQRRRLEGDLAEVTRTAHAERAAAANFRIHDQDEESAQAADARALDAEEQAQAIRTVLARFPTKPSFPRPRSFR